MITIYTDGGCHSNPGPGAWAFAVFNDNQIIYDSSGFVPGTTNNQMELTAILEAMIYCYKNDMRDPITIYSDSMYAVNSITVWMDGWFKKNWVGIKNVDLMQALFMMRNEMPNISFNHVRGHSGVYGNTHVDRLCTSTIRSFRQSKKKKSKKR